MTYKKIADAASITAGGLFVLVLLVFAVEMLIPKIQVFIEKDIFLYFFMTVFLSAVIIAVVGYDLGEKQQMIEDIAKHQLGKVIAKGRFADTTTVRGDGFNPSYRWFLVKGDSALCLVLGTLVSEKDQTKATELLFPKRMEVLDGRCTVMRLEKGVDQAPVVADIIKEIKSQMLEIGFYF